MRGERADRVGDRRGWDDLLAGSAADDDTELQETALLAYAQQDAARWGAERFAAELRRREEEERRQPRRRPALEAPPATSGLVDASVESHAVTGGGRVEPDLGPPAPKLPKRHPYVPRPPTPEPPAGSRRRTARRRRDRGQTPVDAVPDWAWKSKGARRMYGLDEPTSP
jgi:hypothetical protein